MKAKFTFFVTLLFVGVIGCVDEPVQPEPLSLKSAQVDVIQLTPEFLDAMNLLIEQKGDNFRIAMVETITDGSNNQEGQTIYSKFVGNKQLSSDFSPNDTWRTWSADNGNSITYAIDMTEDAEPSGLTAGETETAIVNAFNTWDAVKCSDFGLTRNPAEGIDLGYLAFIYGMDGSDEIAADIMQCGWGFSLAEGTLGATFTFIWVDDINGDPIDENGDGKNDVAFRETYYNPMYPWGVGGAQFPDIDVQSVSLHEIGHCLSQAHFGTISINRAGKVIVAPRAVMNSMYLGPLHTLLGTDNAGHCSIWDEWPMY